MKFTWDTRKEAINRQKHGVSFDETSYVFADPFSLNYYEGEHAEDEDRWVLLG